MTHKGFLSSVAAVGLGAAAFLTGCESEPGPTAPATGSPKSAASHAHGGDTHSRDGATAGEPHEHAPGAHGGTIIEIGRDNYHAEVVFEKEGQVRLYLLGQDETRVQETESQELTAYAKALSGGESIPFTFRPEPQPDDAEGKTSLFVGRLPEGVVGRLASVTIPSIRIAGERFRVGFETPAADHDVSFMPAAAGGDEERELYLTPGGLYTAADITANGGVTATQKFVGVRASHDLKPRPGDTLCPITLTKANAKFSWTVGGKEYEFCCPPCVDEFVRLAKESPDEIRDPADYVKR